MPSQKHSSARARSWVDARMSLGIRVQQSASRRFGKDPRVGDSNNFLNRDSAAPAVPAELSREHRVDGIVVMDLQRQLANAFVLFNNYKRYHWQVFNPMFRDLHELFDQLANEVIATIDPFAERVRAIRPDPLADPVEWRNIATISVSMPHTSLRHM